MKLKILVIGNCQLALLSDKLRGTLDCEHFSINFILSYQNLEPSHDLSMLIAEADYIVTQPIKNYKGLRIEDLAEQAKKCKNIIRVPFVRFHGFWQRSERILSKFSRDCVMFFPQIDSSQVGEYLKCEINHSEDEIQSNYHESIEEIMQIEKGADIPFVSFFLKYHKDVPLFRDPWHPTNAMSRYMLEKTQKVVLEAVGVSASLEDDLIPDSISVVGREYGHYRPITDRTGLVLALEYCLDSYYICSRKQYLTSILTHEDAPNASKVHGFDELECILLRKIPNE